jgi:predicted nucleic acid-binding OB-fold protein
MLEGLKDKIHLDIVEELERQSIEVTEEVDQIIEDAIDNMITEIVAHIQL